MNGNKDDAVAFAQRAVELAPDDADIQRVLEEVKR
jgi:Flp pilus assembly protein TadD